MKRIILRLNFLSWIKLWGNTLPMSSWKWLLICPLPWEGLECAHNLELGEGNLHSRDIRTQGRSSMLVGSLRTQCMWYSLVFTWSFSFSGHGSSLMDLQLRFDSCTPYRPTRTAASWKCQWYRLHWHHMKCRFFWSVRMPVPRKIKLKWHVRHIFSAQREPRHKPVVVGSTKSGIRWEIRSSGRPVWSSRTMPRRGTFAEWISADMISGCWSAYRKLNWPVPNQELSAEQQAFAILWKRLFIWMDKIGGVYKATALRKMNPE